ncbi:class I SAM-dependent methyltransferase [Paenibacillus antri]|nr:class I SAM-dependent methyltransferase [Paenibacillus antri]
MEYLEMLARLGIGDAHPGGFAETVKQLRAYPLPPDAKVLEVGCGTGRTACYVAAQGHRVTGIDIRPDMIAKAKARAEKEKLTVEFRRGDATALPFPDESFDVVLVESVSIFTDTPQALREYYRVLRGGGRLFDREMIRRSSMPSEAHDAIARFYGISKLWEPEDWTVEARNAGFRPFHIDGPFPFPTGIEQKQLYKDEYQQIDTGSLFDVDIWEVTNAYDAIMGNSAEHLGYILLVGSKQSAASAAK